MTGRMALGLKVRSNRSEDWKRLDVPQAYNGGRIRQGGFMPNLWNVVSNTGERLILERGTERIEIGKPEEPLANGMFMKIVTGSTVSDIGVHLLIRSKKLPESEKENDADVIPYRA
jgi:hypothetical protein